jgi:hypothetical protein
MASRGLFYARLEDRDWNFLAKLGDDPPFDGSVIRANYLAEYPPEDRRHGQQHDRITEALEEKGWPWALDPHTAPHAHHRAHEWTTPRARSCTLAQALPLPWTLEHIADPEAQGELIDRSVALQESAGTLAAPYVEVDRRDPRSIQVNSQLITATAERAGDQRILAYLQALQGSLRSGTAAEAARRFIDAGAETIFIRIRGFNSVNLDQLVDYLELVELIAADGARAVADSADYFGTVAIAAGADAMTGGARYFRTVPAALLTRPPEPPEEDSDDEEDKKGGGLPLLYELPGLLERVSPSEEPAAPEGEPALIRTHNFRELQQISRLAAREGLRFAETLRAIGSSQAMLWAEALDQRAERRRAS